MRDAINAMRVVAAELSGYCHIIPLDGLMTLMEGSSWGWQGLALVESSLLQEVLPDMARSQQIKGTPPPQGTRHQRMISRRNATQRSVSSAPRILTTS